MRDTRVKPENITLSTKSAGWKTHLMNSLSIVHPKSKGPSHPPAGLTWGRGAGVERVQFCDSRDSLPKSQEGVEQACALLPVPHTLVLKSASSPQRNELCSPKGHSWSLNNKTGKVWVTLTPYLGYHLAWSTSFAGEVLRTTALQTSGETFPLLQKTCRPENLLPHPKLHGEQSSFSPHLHPCVFSCLPLRG